MTLLDLGNLANEQNRQRVYLHSKWGRTGQLLTVTGCGRSATIDVASDSSTAHLMQTKL